MRRVIGSCRFDKSRQVGSSLKRGLPILRLRTFGTTMANVMLCIGTKYLIHPLGCWCDVLIPPPPSEASDNKSSTTNQGNKLLIQITRVSFIRTCVLSTYHLQVPPPKRSYLLLHEDNSTSFFVDLDARLFMWCYQFFLSKTCVRSHKLTPKKKRGK